MTGGGTSGVGGGPSPVDPTATPPAVDVSVTEEREPAAPAMSETDFEQLRDAAIENLSKQTKKARRWSIAGFVTAAIATVAGIALAPFTGGLSLFLTCGAMACALGGGFKSASAGKGRDQIASLNSLQYDQLAATQIEEMKRNLERLTQARLDQL